MVFSPKDCVWTERYFQLQNATTLKNVSNWIPLGYPVPILSGQKIYWDLWRIFRHVTYGKTNPRIPIKYIKNVKPGVKKDNLVSFYYNLSLLIKVIIVQLTLNVWKYERLRKLNIHLFRLWREIWVFIHIFVPYCKNKTHFNRFLFQNIYLLMTSLY